MSSPALSPDGAAPRRGGALRAVTLRSLALWLHRYVGLALTVFLVLAGLTGSLLAFYRELDELLNPELYQIGAPAPGAPRLDPLAQRAALQGQLPPGLRALRVSFAQRQGVAALLEITPDPGAPYQGDDEFFLDPYTGRLLGSRRWGDPSQGRRNLMPFVYRLHYSLALEEVGNTLLGVVALLWTLDCFIGGYLTFPPARSHGQRGVRVWLERWKPAWLVRGGRAFSLIFTWHRASGLWVWGLLLAFAWSAVGLNLRNVYEPVMKTALGLAERTQSRLPRLDPPRLEPALDWPAAHARGQLLMTAEAQQRRFEILSEQRLVYQPELGAFRYQVQSSLDVSERGGNTTVWFDGQSGRWLGFDAPTGEDAGQTLTTWIYQLHFASVRRLGVVYRCFVSALGLSIAALSVTGAYVWWVKRARRAATPRRYVSVI